MSTFKDKTDHEWDVSLTLDVLNRVEADAGVDLVDPVAIQKLGDNPRLLGTVLYAVLRPQIEDQNLSPEEFAKRFDGDVLERACDALLEGIVDFFPTRKRQTLRRAMAKKKEAETRAMDGVDEIIDSDLMNQQVDRRLAGIRRSLETDSPTSASDAGSSPASLESATPGDTPSAS